MSGCGSASPPRQVGPVAVAASVEIFQVMATPQPDQQRPHTPHPSPLPPALLHAAGFIPILGGILPSYDVRLLISLEKPAGSIR